MQRVVAAHAALAERPQYLAVRAEHPDGVVGVVGGPDVADAVDPQAVGGGEEAVAEGADEGAGLVEDEQRPGGVAAVQDVEVVRRVGGDAGDGAEFQIGRRVKEVASERAGE